MVIIFFLNYWKSNKNLLVVFEIIKTGWQCLNWIFQSFFTKGEFTLGNDTIVCSGYNFLIISLVCFINIAKWKQELLFVGLLQSLYFMYLIIFFATKSLILGQVWDCAYLRQKKENRLSMNVGVGGEGWLPSLQYVTQMTLKPWFKLLFLKIGFNLNKTKAG